jgi:hypothetical protein
MILQCENNKGCKFLIDIKNKSITWDIKGYNRTGILDIGKSFKKNEKGEFEEIIVLTGIRSYSENGNSFITPHIFKDDITECNDWDKLEKLYTIN